MAQQLPLVSVIMAAYNSERYIGEAIESIIAQSYPHWELLITDDGSTDTTAEIVRRYSASDERIRLIQQENRGAAAARNRAIEKSKGKYLAILDSDDIALPTRLEKQVEYLEANPHISLLGSWFRPIGSNLAVKAPTTNGVLQYNFTFCNPFFHSSTIFPKSLAGDGYPEEYLAAHDFALLQRLSEKGDIAILPAVLALRRMHSNTITQRYKRDQLDNAIPSVEKALWRWLPQSCDPMQVTALAHASLFSKKIVATPEQLRKLHQLIKKSFLQQFPSEKKKLRKEFAQREMLYRHFFYNNSLFGKLSRARSLLSYYVHHPKAFLYSVVIFWRKGNNEK